MNASFDATRNKSVLQDIKLTPPFLHGESVDRPRLNERLGQCLDKRLALVTAGAGWGKSTLLASFVHTVCIPVLWYNADESDADPAIFLPTLAKGIGQTLPEMQDTIKTLLEKARQDQSAPAEIVSALLGAVLNALPRHLLIVLDDFHRAMDGPGFTAVVQELIDKAPYNLHLVISSRHAPKLKTGRHLSHGEAICIDQNELGFTGSEVETYLEKTLHIHPGKDQIDDALHFSEGWPVALRLAKDMLGNDRRADLRHALSQERLTDYFLEEIFLTLPQDLQRFLALSSLLNAFDIELLAEVLGEDVVGDHLKAARERNLFLIVLDGGSSWFRYHHLFQDYLQNIIQRFADDAEQKRVHLRAARSLLERGMWRESIIHFLAGDDCRQAESVLQQHGIALMHQGASTELNSWLARFPQSEIDNSPFLMLLRGFCRLFAGKWQQSAADLSKALDAAVAHDRTELIPHLVYHLASLYFYSDNLKGVIAVLEQHAHRIPDDVAFKNLLQTLQLSCYMHLGQPGRAGAGWDELLAQPELENHPTFSSAVSPIMAINYHFPLGQLDQARTLCESALPHLRKNDFLGRYGRCLGFLGAISFEMGLYEESRDYHEQGLAEIRGKGHDPLMTPFLSQQALNAICLKDDALLEQCLSMMDVLEEKAPQLWKQEHLQCARAMAMLYRGQQAPFVSQAGALLEHAATRMTWWDCTYLCLLLAPGIAACGKEEQAIQYLRQALDLLRPLKAMYTLARAHLLLASILHDQKHTDDALSHLRASLAISSEHAYDFLYLHKERSHARKLLPLLLEDPEHFAFISRLLILLHDNSPSPVVPVLRHADAALRAAAAATLAANSCRDAEKSILPLLKDPDPSVRLAAGKALDTLHDLPPLPLSVRTLGGLTIRIGADVIDNRSWKRKSAKSLFLYLLLHAGRDIPAEVLMDTFFPGSGPDEARTQLHQAMSSIRKVLEPGIAPRRESSYLKAGEGSYRLVLPEGSRLDITLFEKRIQEAARAKIDKDPRLALQKIKEALHLYRGDLLPELPYEEWLQPHRGKYRSLAVRSLFELARNSFERFDYPACIEALETLLAMEPWDEGAVLLLMKALLAQNDRARAVIVFQSHQELIERELGLSPAPELIEIYNSLSIRN